MIMLSRRGLILALLTSGLCVVAVSSARSQGYPSRPVTIVSQFAPGGANDLLARLVAHRLEKVFGKSFIVQNQPGAGGNLGAATVARAAPDGYTLLMGTAALAINQTLYRKLPFDVVRDFAPVSLVALIPNVLVVNLSVPFKSVDDLVAYAKANPGRLNYGTAGVGTASHVAMELFSSMTGVRMTHVPFRGSAQAINALLGSQIEVMLDNLPPLAPHIEGKTLRVLGIANAHRHPKYPDVPTIAEAGVPGFEATAWQSVLSPAGTPVPIVERLSLEIRKALDDPEFQKEIEVLGAIPYGTTPQEFQAFLAAEVEKWGKVIKASGATAE
jgi:tripartite-type tricarboxylate transporter receptor subunit TctC